MTTFPNDADGDGLRMIAESGSDFDKPMDVDIQIAAASEETAINIANVVGAMGYRTEIYLDEDVEVEDSAEAWTCECSKVMLLTYDNIVAVQEELDKVVKPLSGFVDGWSTYGNSD